MIPISNFDTLNNAGFMPMPKALLRGEYFLAASSGPWNNIYIFKYLWEL
jgi:hypothetical protein